MTCTSIAQHHLMFLKGLFLLHMVMYYAAIAQQGLLYLKGLKSALHGLGLHPLQELQPCCQRLHTTLTAECQGIQYEDTKRTMETTPYILNAVLISGKHNLM